MAWRLGTYIVEGTLDNRAPLCTRGEILLRDWEQPLELDLVGNPDPDLAGRLLYFRARDFGYGGFEPESARQLEMEPRQFGATGTMTAHYQVRVFPGSVDAFIRRSELGEPPPMEWKRCLTLEWFSNNGRVQLQLADPELWFLEETDEGWRRIPLPPPEDPPFDANDPPAPSEPSFGELPPESELRDESYGLIPPEVSQYLDEVYADTQFSSAGSEAPFTAIDFELSSLAEEEEDGEGDENDDETAAAEEAILRDLEAMDRLLESGPGMEIGEVIGKTPSWKKLSDEEAELHLKMIVARLALYRVTFHVCSHCSARDAYRILTEKIAPNAFIEPALRETEWVTHFDTSDDCEQCQREAEAEWGHDSPDVED
jgi:hypothetical protein